MNLLNFTTIKLTLFLIIGILIGKYVTIDQKTMLGITLALLLVLGTFFYISNKQFHQNIWFGTLAFMSMISIGVLAVSNDPINQGNHYSHLLNTIEQPVNIRLKIRKTLKPSTFYLKYEARVLKIDDRPTTGTVLLNMGRDPINRPPEIDTELLLSTNFQEIKPPLNPFQFNYRAYLENQGIFHQLYVRPEETYLLAKNNTGISGYADRLRSKINTALQKHDFDPDQLSIVNALLLGQRQDIPEEIRSDYINAGAIHILAISGLHIGILLMIFQFVLRPLNHIKHGRIIKILILLAILWSFAIIAGLSASVIRAVSMFTTFTIGINLRRISNSFNLLFISMFILLLIKPSFLFEVGFQLSYAAVFAILWLQPKLYNLWKPKHWSTKRLWELLTVTLAAQLGVLPLSLFYFHQFPGLFFLSNLAIVPILGFILGTGILVIFLALLDMLPSFLASGFQYTIDKLNNFVGWVSAQEAFLFQDITFGFYTMLSCYLLLIGIVHLTTGPNHKRLVYVLFSILLLQGVFINKKYELESTNELVILHKNRSSLMIDKRGSRASVLYSDDSLSTKQEHNVKNYAVGKGIGYLKWHKPANLYQIKNEKLLVVDSLGTYNIEGLRPAYILLSNSPKINLTRLLQTLRPKIIIADGSNYKSYILRWKATCAKKKLPFHHTGEKGAFIIEY